MGGGALRLPTPDLKVSQLVDTETTLLGLLKGLEFRALRQSSVSKKPWARLTCLNRQEAHSLD